VRSGRLSVTHIISASPLRPQGRARIHDLRHTFASAAVAAGQGLPMIGKLLGHAHVATTARYTHLAADPVKAAADEVAGAIASAIGS
jgi:site-specific recombinase XerD